MELRGELEGVGVVLHVRRELGDESDEHAVEPPQNVEGEFRVRFEDGVSNGLGHSVKNRLVTTRENVVSM